jgi:DivIVA domain-containing protein
VGLSRRPAALAAGEDQLVSVFWVLLGIAVLGGVAVVASGRGQGLVDADPDRPDVTLPQDRPVVREDVDRLRFSVGLRGYRMDEVDDVLDRLALDLSLRDGQIGELREELGRRTADPELVTQAEPPADGASGVLEAAAMVPVVQVPIDPVTSRTLLVPLEQFGARGTFDAFDGSDGSEGSEGSEGSDGSDGSDGDPGAGRPDAPDALAVDDPAADDRQSGRQSGRESGDDHG